MRRLLYLTCCNHLHLALVRMHKSLAIARSFSDTKLQAMKETGEVSTLCSLHYTVCAEADNNTVQKNAWDGITLIVYMQPSQPIKSGP